MGCPNRCAAGSGCPPRSRGQTGSSQKHGSQLLCVYRPKRRRSCRHCPSTGRFGCGSRVGQHTACGITGRTRRTSIIYYKRLTVKFFLDGRVRPLVDRSKKHGHFRYQRSSSHRRSPTDGRGFRYCLRQSTFPRLKIWSKAWSFDALKQ